MASSKRQSKKVRTAKEALLVAMFGNEQKGRYQGVTQLALELGYSKSNVCEHLADLAGAEMPLVSKVPLGKGGHDQWVLTEQGRVEAQRFMLKGVRDGGYIAAGPAVPVSDTSSVEGRDFPLFPDLGRDDFILYEVKGESMEGFGIYRGDHVLMRVLKNDDPLPVNAVVAALVPEGTDVTLPDWQERLKRGMDDMGEVHPPPLDHITLKIVDAVTGRLVGSSGVMEPVGYKPIAVLVMKITKYEDGKINRRKP